MKSTFVVLAAYGLLASAAPVSEGVSDTANGMLDVIQGNAACTSVAVIFARGTFDSGNIGVWVGPQFSSAVSDNLGIDSVAFQGVDPAAYKADLGGYMAEGGSNDGAASLVETVNAYATKCTNSSIVVSGWSQGALVAHKALGQISESAVKHVVGVVTFGDPNHVWNNIPLPTSIPGDHFYSACVTGTIFDPLCAVLPVDFEFPTTPSDFIGPFKPLPSVAVGAQQVKAAANLIKQFPGQVLASFDSLVENLKPEQFVRLLLTPQHFMYGNNGMAKQAADFISDLEGVRAAVKG